MQECSVVLSCAGVGSRLGLAKTKALLDMQGYPLIAWQLDLLKNVDDIRIVVGYQANAVIETVLQYRKDVIFVYNHRYFETKTAESLLLGAKHAKPYVIALDGDLIIHPDDMEKILQTQGEYICYSDKRSEDAVYITRSESGNVTSFSRVEGDFEWTGPVRIHKNKLTQQEHVYNQLEPLLPMPGMYIRACDIDTYEDYLQAKELFSLWYSNKHPAKMEVI